MDSYTLIDNFSTYAKAKGIDRPTLIAILEDTFRTMIQRKFSTDENFDIIINVDEGDLEIWRNREIVEDDRVDFNGNFQIRLKDALKIQSDFEVGEEVAEEIKISDFDRRHVQAAIQGLTEKTRELEQKALYKRYKTMKGELITGEVHQILHKEILIIDSEGNELSLAKSELMVRDFFYKGDSTKAVIKEVSISFDGILKVELSRISPDFLMRLVEQEVPEISDGLITIKEVVRIPGERAKIAVESYDDRIDPVGACVGVKGSRIHPVVRELHNENIDIISYTENLDLYISRSLSPARTNSIKIDKTKNRVAVYLNRDQVSKAIGRNGQNIKLASRLIHMEIDVFRELVNSEENEEDVELSEFSDVIEEWVIDELKRIGLDTAKRVLSISYEDLVKRTDLEEETVESVLDILRKEFE